MSVMLNRVEALLLEGLKVVVVEECASSMGRWKVDSGTIRVLGWDAAFVLKGLEAMH